MKTLRELVAERDQAYRDIRAAANKTGRWWTDTFGMFCAACSTPEGEEAYRRYDEACVAISNALRGTKYHDIEPWHFAL